MKKYIFYNVTYNLWILVIFIVCLLVLTSQKHYHIGQVDAFDYCIEQLNEIEKVIKDTR
jgi:hypothetical protein